MRLFAVGVVTGCLVSVAACAPFEEARTRSAEDVGVPYAGVLPTDPLFPPDAGPRAATRDGMWLVRRQDGGMCCGVGGDDGGGIDPVPLLWQNGISDERIVTLANGGTDGSRRSVLVYVDDASIRARLEELHFARADGFYRFDVRYCTAPPWPVDRSFDAEGSSAVRAWLDGLGHAAPFAEARDPAAADCNGCGCTKEMIIVESGADPTALLAAGFVTL